MDALISDIAVAMLRARQCDGVVRRCAKAPHDVQNAVRAVETSALILTQHDTVQYWIEYECEAIFTR